MRVRTNIDTTRGTTQQTEGSDPDDLREAADMLSRLADAVDRGEMPSVDRVDVEVTL